jgi:hypothetical protein
VPEGNRLLENLRVHGMVTLGWILRKWLMRVCAALTASEYPISKNTIRDFLFVRKDGSPYFRVLKNKYEGDEF